MEWFLYFVGLPMAVLFLCSVIYALYWASKNGQLREFDKGAASIFDDSEPIGQATDFFPGKAPGPDSSRKSRN